MKPEAQMWNEQSDQGGKWTMKSYIVAGYIRRFERFEDQLNPGSSIYFEFSPRTGLLSFVNANLS